MSPFVETDSWSRQRGSALLLSAVAAAPEGVVNGNIVVGFGAAAADLSLDKRGAVCDGSVKSDGNDCRVYYHSELSQDVDAHAGVWSWEVSQRP